MPESAEAIDLRPKVFTDRPFAEALSKLKAERGLSYRQLAAMSREADPAGRGISYAYVARLARDDYPPNLNTIAAVARALDLPPGYFVEYRLAEARRLFDERQRGFGAALAELESFTSSRRGTRTPRK
jgi:transcriptional regulator with XRE-family HTH domain